MSIKSPLKLPKPPSFGANVAAKYMHSLTIALFFHFLPQGMISFHDLVYVEKKALQFNCSILLICHSLHQSLFCDNRRQDICSVK